MSSTDLNNEMIRAYLLGELRPEQCEDLERRLQEEPEPAARMENVENELIELYVGVGLNERDRMNFERYFLCTEDRRGRVALVRSLSRRGARAAKPNYFARMPLAAAACVAAILIGALVFAVLQKQNRNVLTAALQPASLDRESGVVQEVRTDGVAKVLELRLAVPANIKLEQYRAVLRNFNGDEAFAWQQPRAQPASGTIVLSLPLALVPAGEYRLSLSVAETGGRLEEVATYLFRLVETR